MTSPVLRELLHVKNSFIKLRSVIVTYKDHSIKFLEEGHTDKEFGDFMRSTNEEPHKEFASIYVGLFRYHLTLEAGSPTWIREINEGEYDCKCVWGDYEYYQKIKRGA